MDEEVKVGIGSEEGGGWVATPLLAALRMCPLGLGCADMK